MTNGVASRRVIVDRAADGAPIAELAWLGREDARVVCGRVRATCDRSGACGNPCSSRFVRDNGRCRCLEV